MKPQSQSHELNREIRITVSRDGQELLVHIPVRLTREYFQPNKPGWDASILTKREKEVFELVIKGKVAKEISSELNIAVRTVKFFLSEIYRKFQVSGVRELLAVRNPEYTVH